MIGFNSCKDEGVISIEIPNKKPDHEPEEEPEEEENPIDSIYYITADGSDENDGISQETAWQTSGRLSEVAEFKPGDVILFKRGEQFGPIALDQAGNGTVENPIIIGAYGDESLPRPIIQATHEVSNAVHIMAMSGITIQDLKIQGAQHDQLYIDPTNGRCDNIKILNCHVDGINGRHCIRFETDIRSGFYFGCDNVEIAYNYIENAGQGFDKTSDGLNCPNIQNNAYIHHNTFFYNKSEAIDLGAGKGHLVEFNIMNGNGERHSGGIKTHVQSGNQIHDTENVMIRNNIILKCIQHAVQIQDGRYIKVYNNTIYHNEQDGKNALLIATANDNQYDDDTWLIGNELINNIFYGVTSTITASVVRFGGGREGTPSVYWDDTTRYKISNNIFYAGPEPNATVVRVQTEDFFVEKPYTEYSNSGSAISLPFDNFLEIHGNNYNVDPMFVDPGNEIFELKEDSPAINAGIEIGITSDFYDQIITDLPDIGAIEF